MNNDIYFTIAIGIFIVFILLNLFPTTQFCIRNQSVILHFAILLCIVFLFYAKYEKSAFMVSLLYLITYVKSYKTKEYYENATDLPDHSVDNTQNKTYEKTMSLLKNNNLPSQIISWFTGDSFDSSTKDINWRDLASNNHIYFNTKTVNLNSSTDNTKPGPQKWISGDTTSQLILPLSASTSTNNITFIHLTRYNPRTANRGKIWSSENDAWVSGYNDNKITATNTNGTELSNIGGDKNGDIMNIRGSTWNLFVDQMNTYEKTRTVNVNGKDYTFQNSMQAIPNKIGLNINSGEKSDWECAEIMVYSRILDDNELQKIYAYFNKKYSLKSQEKLEASKYNIYNHYTFNSIPDNDWNSPPKVGSTTQRGNKLLGVTDSEYECVSLCDKNTTTCAAFSYHMEKGACYSVDEKYILDHTTPNKSVLSGTNRKREDIAQKAKEEADRKAREEAERQRQVAAAAAEAAAKAAAEAAAKAVADALAKAAADAAAAKAAADAAIAKAAADAAAEAAAEAARNSYEIKDGVSGVWGRLGWPPAAGNINGHTFLGTWNNADQCKTQCTNNKNCDGFSFHKGYPGSWQGTCYSTSSGLATTSDGSVISQLKQNKAPIIGRSWQATINSPNNYINFTTKNNITLMHFNPRSSIIVLNSYNGGWAQEVYLNYSSSFPFKVGIKITNAGFEISMNGSYVYTFAHRYDVNTFDHIDTNNQIIDTTP